MSGFLKILTTDDPDQRKALWRAAMADLGRACHEEHAGLDALPGEALARGVALALESGWLDEPGELSAHDEALAVWELAAALPPGRPRAELERRSHAALRRGNAVTFAALAARMVQAGDLRLDEGRGVRARVTLCLGLPASSGVASDRLAMAMVTRPSVARDWLEEQSMLALPQRRAASRLLEQSARGAVRAPQEGWLRRVLTSDVFQVAHARLLADREPLVWHHAAVARGLLAPFHEPFRRTILAGLSPDLSLTAWLRAATSLAAWLAHGPGEPLELLRAQLSAGLTRRARGLTGALVRGLAAAHSPVADEALGLLLDADPPGVAEALGEAIEQGLSPSPAHLAAALAALTAHAPRAAVDDGVEALRQVHLEALRDGPEGTTLGAIREARQAFIERDAPTAARQAIEALDRVEAGVATLALLDEAEGDDVEATEVRRRLFAVLHQLQRAVLHDGDLDALLALSDDDEAPGLRELSAARDWITTWVLGRWVARPSSDRSTLPHPCLHLQQVLTLLYAADLPSPDPSPAALASARQRRQDIAAAMLQRLHAGVPRPLERATCAALARALDALLIEGALSPTDVVLLAARATLDESHLVALTEASTSRELDVLLSAYLAAFRDTLGGALASTHLSNSIPPTQRAPSLQSFSTTGNQRPGSSAHHSLRPGSSAHNSIPPSTTAYGFFDERLRRLGEFALQIDASAAPGAAFQGALRRLTRALQRLLSAGSIADALEVNEEGETAVAALDASWEALVRQVAAAEQRLRLPGDFLDQPRPIAPALTEAMAARDSREVSSLLSRAQNDLERTLPEVFSSLASPVLGSLVALPLTTPTRPRSGREQPLPAWVPAHRMLGGFYVVAPVGSGGAGSVFIARRASDRGDPKAERFALKVPDYESNTTRALTEEQFLQLFREEAAALLHLPAHPNLSRFVTFDLAARPKPILVMELVEGPSIDQLTPAPPLDPVRVGALLDGVLAGLEAMHALGLGHHDIKPQNVILRGGREPVLVDFGLAGRSLRPGCGSLAYSAPEVWLGTTPSATPSTGADIYAVACLAFELLTGEPLFTATSEVTAIAAHVAHDGWPAPLQAQQQRLGPLADLLHRALRRDPADRLSASAFRRALRELR